MELWYWLVGARLVALAGMHRIPRDVLVSQPRLTMHPLRLCPYRGIFQLTPPLPFSYTDAHLAVLWGL